MSFSGGKISGSGPVVDTNASRDKGRTAPGLTRRGFLCAGGGAAMSLAASALCAPAFASGDFDFEDIRKVNLRHARTGERFSHVYYEYGEYLPEATSELDYLLRDYRAEKTIMMDVRLFDLLAQMQYELSGEELLVTSGYRTRTTNDRLRRRSSRAARNSLHIQGMAVDFYSQQRSVRMLTRLARSLNAGGVGSYRGARFIHADVGPVRFWRR